MNKRPNPIERFLQLETSSSIILFAATIGALVWANFFSYESYHHLWETKFTIGLGDFNLSKPIHLWINDGLMAIFFFVIGLEIKREIISGELSSMKKASLPLIGALGGMVIPLAVFVGLNYGKEGIHGWGIPMATDIAFSLGVIMLLGKRVPVGLKIFLTAFAIVDDIGAVLIIAIFYSGNIDWMLILYSLLILAFLSSLNFINYYSKILFLAGGLVVWYFFLKAGIHPTVAGVLLAFTIPARQKVDVAGFYRNTLSHLKMFVSAEKEGEKKFFTHNQLNAIDNIEEEAENVQSPLQRLENKLHGSVSFIIMPLFAFSNAGVLLFGGGSDGHMHLSVNIALALIFGKSIGIGLFSILAKKLGISSFPAHVKNVHIIGVAFLGGIGFTMSLFISNLAFKEQGLLDASKIGILAGSLIAGLIGYLILRGTKPVPQTTPEGETEE